MKKAPSTILAAAGITVGLLGFALPASATPVPTHQPGQSGPNWKTLGHDNNKNKNKKQPPHNCQPPRDNKGGKQHKGHHQPTVLAESQTKNIKNDGRNDGKNDGKNDGRNDGWKAPGNPWGQPTGTIACHPAPPQQHGKGKNDNKGHTTTWTNHKNNRGHGPNPK
jgi:hypothetical protein